MQQCTAEFLLWKLLYCLRQVVAEELGSRGKAVKACLQLKGFVAVTPR